MTDAATRLAWSKRRPCQIARARSDRRQPCEVPWWLQDAIGDPTALAGIPESESHRARDLDNTEVHERVTRSVHLDRNEILPNRRSTITCGAWCLVRPRDVVRRKPFE